MIAASGTITQLIPPSLVLIVLADQLGRSVGDMYAGAIGPSIDPDRAVLHLGLHRQHRSGRTPCRRCRRRRARCTAGRCAANACAASCRRSALIFLVLGTIFLGLATPTEAGAMGVGRRACCWRRCNRRLTWPLICAGDGDHHAHHRDGGVHPDRRDASSASSSRASAARRWIEHLLTALPGGQIGFLIFVNIFIFFLAFFLDFFEIAFIVIPLLAPVAAKLGIDLVWFGVLICANMQTSFMHPPFGFALFYLRGDRAARRCKTSDIYWGAMPWVVLQLILVAIVIFWPRSVTYWLTKGPAVDRSTISIEIELRICRRCDPCAARASVGRQLDQDRAGGSCVTSTRFIRDRIHFANAAELPAKERRSFRGRFLRCRRIHDQARVRARIMKLS